MNEAYYKKAEIDNCVKNLQEILDRPPFLETTNITFTLYYSDKYGQTVILSTGTINNLYSSLMSLLVISREILVQYDLEKQLKKKVLNFHDTQWICPNCGNKLSLAQAYCSNCGQNIGW